MKRRIESKLLWDFCKYSTKPSLATTLAASKEDPDRGPFFVKSISVQSDSSMFGIRGHLRVDLDRYDWAERQGQHFDQAYLAIMQLNSRLYREKIMGGKLGLGGSDFTMEFTLESGHMGFCEEAIKRALIVLEGIGVKKEEITTPDISQRTLVWVPEAHPLRGEHYHKYGWIEYGIFLGDLYGLSSRT